ncbi:MAG: zinc ribbon domain-containing protein [Candidatus Thermoplasmatota archaeon]|nr:zinc ribbon domain-containing protein [Candidatus Thermoplasmatota archaeon]
MEKRLRNGMLLMGVGILLAVLAGIFGLLTYTTYDTTDLSFVFSISALVLTIAAFVLKVVGLFMIFTRRKTLGKGRGLVTMGFFSFISLIMVFIIGVIIELIFIFTMNPRYNTIYLILTELASGILGSIMVLLPVYPLLSKKLKKRAVYSLVAIIIISLAVQPFVFNQMKEVEDEFNVEFEGQSYQGLSDTLKEDDELTTNITAWISNNEEISNLLVYNSITLIPYAYIGLMIFLYARKIKKRGDETVDFRHPGVMYPSAMLDSGERKILKKEEKCRYCGAELIAELDFCPSCGAYLKE